MKGKKAISILFILVLSLQLLPLKQMVSWLISNQVTEEIQHGGDGTKKTAGGIDEVHKWLGADHQLSINLLSKKPGLAVRHDDEALCARLADDIPTPPPNS
jgi:flagellar basal body-associated protein FliL